MGKSSSLDPFSELNQLMKNLSKQPVINDSGLGLPQQELNQLVRWGKSFRNDAEVDKYAIMRNHLKMLGLPKKPKLMLEGTVNVMRAVWVYNCLDQKPLSKFIEMQQYDPAKAPNAEYVLTFDLGKAYARILTDKNISLPDLADLYNHAFMELKTIGYNRIYISHPDWSPLKKKELNNLKKEVKNDLRFDYSEDEVGIRFVPGASDIYLFVSVYDIEYN